MLKQQLKIIIGLLITLFPAALHAQVALSTNSSIAVTAQDSSGSSTSSMTVDSLPFTQDDGTDMGLENSSLTPNLTTTSFLLSFSQTLGDADAGTSGTAELFFVPQSNVTFTISGNESDDDAGNTLFVELQDLTRDTLQYYYNQSDAFTLTLDSSGGSLTGSLVPGDVYEFSATESDAHDFVAGITPAVPASPDFTGTANIVFSQVPEPTGAALLLFVSAAQLFRTRRPKQSHSTGRHIARCGNRWKQPHEAPSCSTTHDGGSSLA